MAWASAELAKRVREDLKKEFPLKEGWKFQVSKKDGTLTVRLMTAPYDVFKKESEIDWDGALMDYQNRYGQRGSDNWIESQKEALNNKVDSLYLYSGSSSFDWSRSDNSFFVSEKARKDLDKIASIINEGNHDNSDTMTDYFDVGYYVSFYIGRNDWNKTVPFEVKSVKGKKSSPKKSSGKSSPKQKDDFGDLIYTCSNGFNVYRGKNNLRPEFERISLEISKDAKRISKDEFKYMMKDITGKTTLNWRYWRGLISVSIPKDDTTTFDLAMADVDKLCDIMDEFYPSNNGSKPAPNPDPKLTHEEQRLVESGFTKEQAKKIWSQGFNITTEGEREGKTTYPLKDYDDSVRDKYLQEVIDYKKDNSFTAGFKYLMSDNPEQFLELNGFDLEPIEGSYTYINPYTKKESSSDYTAYVTKTAKTVLSFEKDNAFYGGYSGLYSNDANEGYAIANSIIKSGVDYLKDVNLFVNRLGGVPDEVAIDIIDEWYLNRKEKTTPSTDKDYDSIIKGLKLVIKSSPELKEKYEAIIKGLEITAKEGGKKEPYTIKGEIAQTKYIIEYHGDDKDWNTRVVDDYKVYELEEVDNTKKEVKLKTLKKFLVGYISGIVDYKGIRENGMLSDRDIREVINASNNAVIIKENNHVGDGTYSIKVKGTSASINGIANALMNKPYKASDGNYLFEYFSHITPYTSRIYYPTKPMWTPIKDVVKYKFKDGGMVHGASHANGGVKFRVSDTGQVVELEGGEGVLKEDAMSSDEVYTVTGTPRDIASKLNTAYGGKDFSEGDAKIKKA